MKRILLVLIILALAACGSQQTTGVGSDAPRGASSVKAISAQAILSTLDRGAKYREGEVLVKFRSGASAARSHMAVGGSTMQRLSLVNAERVKLPQGVTVRDAIIKYMQDPNVEYAEPNYIRSIKASMPNDTFFTPQQWGLFNTGTFASGRAEADIRAPQAWDFIRGSGIVIAVLDSGVDYTHQDLVNNIWKNTAENCNDGIDNDGNGYIDDCRGWNFIDSNNTPLDDLGHGTHVAGIIGATGNNGFGVTGVMWNVQIMPVKFLDSDGFGTLADEVAGIQYAVSNGAKIINASFGGSEYSQAEFDAINAASAAGVLLVAAAGNGSMDGVGDNNDTLPDYPAAYNLPNIISVAATDQTDNRAHFSNFGPASVHVAAPGVYILSTVPPGLSFSMCTGSMAAGYDFCSGTSMAAPFVSGLAGLTASYYPMFSISQLRGMIFRYVDVLPALQGWVLTGGRINAYRTTSALLTPTGLTATAGSTTQISLAWSDNATGEDGYKIERMQAGGSFGQVALVGPNTSSFTDGGLTPGASYTYRVKAYNIIPADSAPSNEASATTPSSGPSSPPATGGGGGGGCSIGGRTNTATSVGDAAVMLAPLAVIAAMVLRRRRR